jgi:HSP20 family protein
MLPETTRRERGLVRRPWVGALRPDLGNLFDEFFGQPLSTWSAWMPTTDLYETPEAFVLEMELPGFKLDDIELTMEKGVLTVTGERKVLEEKEETEERTYHLRERSFERFTRSYALPRLVETDKVDASFSNGVLLVTLPKAAEAKPRRITVKAGK